MVQPILLLTMLCLLITFAVVAYFFVRRRTLEASLKIQVNDLKAQVTDYRDRLDRIELHATDYINSIGANGSRDLFQLRSIILTLEKLVTDIEACLVTPETESMLEARALLEKTLAGAEEAPPARNKEQANLVTPTTTLPPGWEMVLESLIQDLGSKIAQASLSADHAGIPKRRKKERTLLSLIHAGIKPSGPYQW